TRNQRVFARWNWKNESSQIDWGLLPESPERVPNRGFVAAHTYAPRSNVSNELRYGLMWSQGEEKSPIKGKDAVAALGLEGLDLRNAGDGGGFPGFIFAGTSFFDSIGRGRNQYVAGRNYQANDTLSWSHGAHTLQLGGELQHVRYRAALTKGRSDDFGAFRFTGVFSGNDFADLLL